MTTLDATADPDATAARDRGFLGHPIALAYLCATEGWERFSYYGMQSLLVLYLAKQLLLPGHVEHIVAFPALKWLLSGGAELSSVELGSRVFGLYTSLVYLTPILGGLVADRITGRRIAVLAGACIMALGHFLMAFEAAFLMALLCLVIGCGLIKGNIATQVGALYAADDPRRPDAFQLFFLAINGAVIISPLIVGTLGEHVAWHWGFGAAGVGMLIALLIYIAGFNRYPDDPVRRTAAAVLPPLSRAERRRLVFLVGLLPVLSLAVLGNQEVFNAYLIWADRQADLSFGGDPFPTSWLITLDAILGVTFLTLTMLFWRLWARHFPEPDEPGKIAIGCLISISGFVVLALGAWHTSEVGGKVPLPVLVLFDVLNSIGFANIFPIALAFYSRLAPPAIAATFIGIFYLHLFIGNFLVGWIGGWIDRMPAAEFWSLHAAIALAAGLIFLAIRPLVRRLV